VSLINADRNSNNHPIVGLLGQWGGIYLGIICNPSEVTQDNVEIT